MTAAIEKAVRLHLYLMQEYPYLKPQISTDSVPSITSSDGNYQIKERSAIHITLTKAWCCLSSIYQYILFISCNFFCGLLVAYIYFVYSNYIDWLMQVQDPFRASNASRVQSPFTVSQHPIQFSTARPPQYPIQFANLGPQSIHPLSIPPRNI